MVNTQPTPQPNNHRAVISHFVAACQADERIVAAFLGGSYATGTADTYSDVDFCVVTTDAAYDGFLGEREAFIRLLGEPLFLESFNLPHIAFFILADGTECELACGRESAFQHVHGGPYRVLLDRTGILDGVVFPWETVEPEEQREELRRQITWFWHDLSHFTAAMGRGELWWAYGQLEELRRICVKLARLRQDFNASPDGYEKLEKAVPVEQLARLAATYRPMERAAMLAAALVIVEFYRELAASLALEHGLPYPQRLDEVQFGKLAAILEPAHG